MQHTDYAGSDLTEVFQKEVLDSDRNVQVKCLK